MTLTPPVPKGFRFPDIEEHLFRKLGPVLRASFGEQVARISLDGGYTCPNRDGTLASGGCTYCGEGSRALIPRAGSISRQFLESVSFRKERAFIAYFQSFSGTYAPLDVLQRQWREARSLPGVVGLAISTRPDCLPKPVIRELARLANELPLWIELGLESADDATLRRINRAHDVNCFVEAAGQLADAGIPVVAHLIFGLPQEPDDAPQRAISLINGLPVWGLKIHPFHVVRGAPIARAWERGKLSLKSRDWYVDQAADALTRLRPDIVVHRITGSGAGPKHLAPDWAVQTKKLYSDIERRLRKRNLRQGALI
ncbi:MAG: TIGR01212 family radical SAM protein [Candidatus Dadabacteria bacterium]|nr:MAG: TIGR01212 family radical SAM protein [Candidatus Dadabacteria bacterium]